MPITQSVNSKANVKRPTTNDIPFGAQQPVINSYYATSTAGQTVINFGFSIQTTGVFANTDVFWLFVDGKKLDLGSSNDYTFTNVGSDGTSSQVTLVNSLLVGLNIQAFKLGLKPEVQFGMDNRFTQLYANQAAGFQGFVSQTDFINTATTTTGTPAAGTFYSSITGRAPMVDLSQNLKPQFGIERISVQQIQLIQNEFGPNGEQIWGAPNDTYGQLRYGGVWGSGGNSNLVNGVSVSSGTVGDFIEITFYGTGLNILTIYNGGAVSTVSSSVDGVALSSNIYTVVGSNVLQSRNYGPNAVLPIVSGLTLGIHTVRLTLVTLGSLFFNTYGFEVITQVSSGSSLVSVNSGIAYNQGQKATLASQSQLAYNAAVTGTTGGRVVEYLTSAGTRGQAFTQNATSASYLTAASHTNEEVVRTYYPREFGAGRTDDFSALVGAYSNAVFTLDDGSTCLIGNSVLFEFYANVGNAGLRIAGQSGSYTAFTFIGTGLDIELVDSGSGGASVITVQVDGASTGSISYTASNIPRMVKIASGLPYGSHTVKFLYNTQTSYYADMLKMVVYQPKTPSIPSGAVQLGSYNVMATYSDSALGNNYFTLPVGGLYKSDVREITYSGSGTWSVDTNAPAAYSGPSGNQMFNTSSGAVFQYTWFGTGIALQFSSNSGFTKTYSVTIDGVSNSSGTVYGGATNAGGGSYTIPSGSALCRWISFQGLTLGTHTIVVTCTDATGGNIIFDGIVLNTPIHSPKSNLYADLQNTLSVGSNAISDDRQTQPVKSALPATKAWAQAQGVTSTPSTSATAPVPMPDMTCTVKTSGGVLDISWSASIYSGTVGTQVVTRIYVDGVPVGYAKNSNVAPTANNDMAVSDRVFVPVTAGTHTVTLYWQGTNTVVTDGTERILQVKEM